MEAGQASQTETLAGQGQVLAGLKSALENGQASTTAVLSQLEAGQNQILAKLEELTKAKKPFGVPVHSILARAKNVTALTAPSRFLPDNG